MKVNHDYMKIMRSGLQGRIFYRKQQESGFIIGGCLFLAGLLVVFAILFGCFRAGEVHAFGKIVSDECRLDKNNEIVCTVYMEE